MNEKSRAIEDVVPDERKSEEETVTDRTLSLGGLLSTKDSAVVRSASSPLLLVPVFALGVAALYPDLRLRLERQLKVGLLKVALVFLNLILPLTRTFRRRSSGARQVA
mmetsp:Transcript_24182/g.64893  ORF Transcript_24182/g.64893 Transcript_24182/m.64893 type:complete len:108 (-) Transcript_24182:65-388(-)